MIDEKYERTHATVFVDTVREHQKKTGINEIEKIHTEGAYEAHSGSCHTAESSSHACRKRK